MFRLAAAINLSFTVFLKMRAAFSATRSRPITTLFSFVSDLSKNRFTELPDEVTTYIFLEKLLLSQNVISNVPDSVGGLQSLTYLDLR